MSETIEARDARLAAERESGRTIPVDEFKGRSRRSFLTGIVGAASAYAGWQFLRGRPDRDGIPEPLRDALEFNERIWTNLAEDRLAPEHPLSDARPIQVNGRIGIRDEIDLDAWTVRVEGPDGELLDELDIAHFENLPQRDMVIEHKCIEGWSNVTHWGGTAFSNFHEAYADRIPADAQYVGMETPDGEYYVGMDLSAMLHPQALLTLRQNGEPLTQIHGAPLRFATPKRYGIKTIKRIGVIRYERERPADYWAERSYDWYAGV